MVDVASASRLANILAIAGRMLEGQELDDRVARLEQFTQTEGRR
jgi:hypothetical protein